MPQSSPRPSLVSLNFLERPTVCRDLAHEQIHPESPAAIKKNLELDKLDRILFPTLVTGVRWWPFLCIAITNSKSRSRKAFDATRQLKKALGLKKTARLGPDTDTSLRPYISMARNIQESQQCNALRRYLERLHFTGKASFFVNYKHDKKWKELLLASNGAPAEAYIRAYLDKEKILKERPRAEDVVSLVLENEPETFHSVLWQGCFSYAFIRCLYGRFDPEESKAVSHRHVLGWKQSLIEIIKKQPKALPTGVCNHSYILLLRKINNESSPPPLAKQTAQFRRQGRPVLASLRIPLFHRLYFNSKPVRMRD